MNLYIQYGEMIFTLLILTQAINIILFRGGGFLNGIMGKRMILYLMGEQLRKLKFMMRYLNLSDFRNVIAIIGVL